MTIVAVANEKGGVGKTTSTLTIGAALVELGYRVALVGLDQQRDLTSYAATMQSADLHFWDADGKTLRRVIKCAKQWHADFVLLDCPPALGGEVTTSLLVCDVAIVPTQPEGPSLDAINRMLQTLDAANQSPRRKTALDWRLLVTMFDTRDPAAPDVEDFYRAELPGRVLDVHISRHPAFNEVALKRDCVLSVPRIKPAAQYRHVARDLAKGWPQVQD